MTATAVPSTFRLMESMGSLVMELEIFAPSASSMVAWRFAMPFCFDNYALDLVTAPACMMGFFPKMLVPPSRFLKGKGRSNSLKGRGSAATAL